MVLRRTRPSQTAPNIIMGRAAAYRPAPSRSSRRRRRVTTFSTCTPAATSGGATITSDLYDANGVIIRSFTDAFSAAAGQNFYTDYTFDFTGGAYLATTVTSTNLYNNSFHTVNLQAASLSTPEPSSVATFALAGLGMAGLVFTARKRRALA